MDLATAARRQMWREKIEAATAQPASDRLYACAAGTISFYVTAAGRIQPCVSAARHGVAYERGAFLAAFRASRRSVQAVPAPAAHAGLTARRTTAPETRARAVDARPRTWLRPAVFIAADP